MAVTADRQVNIQYSGTGLNANNSFPAAQNTSSPAQNSYTNLSSGANTINTPTGAVSVTIVPPSGNTVSITLKGISGDTGIRIHNTDPSSIAIDSSVTSFVLTAANPITGVRILWS